MIAETPRLTGLETTVLAWADREERSIIRTADLAALVGPSGARKAASSLAHKGLFSRIGHGLYRVEPLRALATRRSTSTLASVALTMGDRPYYVGGRRAATLHNLTTQMYSTVVDVYAPRAVRPRQLGASQLVWHPVQPATLDFGLDTIEAEGFPLRISDAERTILDLLDRPTRLLGFGETRHILEDNLGRRLQADRLVQYATRWPKHSTIRRLGVLLERAGAEAPILAPLVAALRGATGDVVLVPGSARRGPTHPVFRVILNEQAA